MRRLKGKIVSDKMDKTVVVEVDRLKKHAKYEQRFKVSKRYKAHNPENAHKLGEIVTIEECRPISKDKKWIIAS
jgi:small subunit ribosomal protein S17